MTGIYECYCRSASNYLTPLFTSEFDICRSFEYLDFKGGVYATLPFGMIIGILNNVGAILVIKNIGNIGFHSNQT